MGRRDFIRVVAGSAVTWPLAASAQQTDAPDWHPHEPRPARGAQAGPAASGLERTQCANRHSLGRGHDRPRAQIRGELVALAPDEILASGIMSVAALQSLSRTLPIVFAAVGDPVGAGFVESIAHPGGNGPVARRQPSFGGKADIMRFKRIIRILSSESFYSLTRAVQWPETLCIAPLSSLSVLP